jgi:hypothetical protein
MATIYLIHKEKWYDMVDAGIKMEDYRDMAGSYAKMFTNGKIKANGKWHNAADVNVVFAHGYQKNRRTMKFRVRGLRVGIGKEEWGADQTKNQYILEIGERLA